MTNKRSLKLLALTITSILTSSAFAADIIQLTGNDTQAYNMMAGHAVQFNSGTEFKSIKGVKVANNKTKYRLQQYYKGVPIFGYSVVSDSPTSKNYNSFVGLAVNNINSDDGFTKPDITADEALQLSLPNGLKIDDSSISNKQATLHIYVPKDDPNHQEHLVYITSYFREGIGIKPTRPFHIIDAHSKKVLDSWDGLNTDKIGTGVGGNEKTGKYNYGPGGKYGYIDITKKGDKCFEDSEHVTTINLDHWHFWNSWLNKAANYKCDGDSADNQGKPYHGAYSVVNDAQYFGNIIFDMYKDWFNAAPLTIKLVMRVHYYWKFENAQWNGKNMTFGDGNKEFYPLVALDVTAHEISHGFTEQNSGLIYKGQSGAMNEAFSDMAGEAAKYYMNDGKNDFLVGADIVKDPKRKALRFFADPTLDGKSIGSAKDYNSSLNVHNASGVYNKAFYTLAHQPNWNTKKAFMTFAKANQLYWTADSNFQDGACGVYKAAKDMNYSTDDVVNAFAAVDITNLCES